MIPAEVESRQRVCKGLLQHIGQERAKTAREASLTSADNGGRPLRADTVEEVEFATPITILAAVDRL